MTEWIRSAFLHTSKAAYQLARPLIFRSSPQDAHEQVMALLSKLDENQSAQALLQVIHNIAFERHPTRVGGVNLPYPFILAAGFVKGLGYETEAAACQAVQSSVNIVPGWRSMSALVGPVEYGSYTRHPRLGNLGEVMWRDVTDRSSQNRVGLKNPGAVAAAAFFARHQSELPPIFGINIATSPGVDDLGQQEAEVIESLTAFTSQGIMPTWFTLNLSCPNTEDDPGNNQTTEIAQTLSRAAVEHLNGLETHIPLWVKISPDLSPEQYHVLADVFVDTGVAAVIASNTLAAPSPSDSSLIAGVGGSRLHAHAIEAVRILHKHNSMLDIIGCGGVQTPRDYFEFHHSGAKAVQYWTGLIYRGPLLAALILNEV